MAATLVDRSFNHPGWVFGPKLDRLRVLARFDGWTLALVHRNDKPMEAMFPEVAAALRAALRQPAVPDGKGAHFDERRRTSFRALRQRFQLADPAEVRARAARCPASVYLYDLLWLAGQVPAGEPLAERKRLLRRDPAWVR